jgi:hypothetical protein
MERRIVYFKRKSKAESSSRTGGCEVFFPGGRFSDDWNRLIE